MGWGSYSKKKGRKQTEHSLNFSLFADYVYKLTTCLIPCYGGRWYEPVIKNNCLRKQLYLNILSLYWEIQLKVTIRYYNKELLSSNIKIRKKYYIKNTTRTLLIWFIILVCPQKQTIIKCKSLPKDLILMERNWKIQLQLCKYILVITKIS